LNDGRFAPRARSEARHASAGHIAIKFWGE
jgi:hypothetical protein